MANENTCAECGASYVPQVLARPNGLCSDECRRVRRLAAKARYREKNRETLRSKGLVYEQCRRRAAGASSRGSDVWRARLSASRAGRPVGVAHHLWKGDAVGYGSLHDWVRRHKSKDGACAWCGEDQRSTDWANLSGRYLRDLDDYVELCRPCHRRYDLGIRRAVS